MRRKIRESFAKGPGPFIKGWPIPISTTDSCLFLPAIYCFKLGWFQTQRLYIKTQTYTQTTFPAKVVRKMMMPGYDRESKNDGRESTAKGFAKEVFEYNEMVIRFWTLLMCAPYVIFTYFYHKFKPNAGKHSIHGAFGLYSYLTYCVFQHFKLVFPNIVVPQNGWFIMENPIKMDDLGGPPLFLKTPKWTFTT